MLTLSFRRKWIETHKRHLPVILGITGFVFFIEIFLFAIVSGETALHFGLNELVILLDFTLLPIAAVNGVFFFQWATMGTKLKSWHRLLLFSLIATLSVAVMSATLEWIYSTWGYVDDDYFILGDYKASASATNVIEYSIAAFFISIPLFTWQFRLRRLDVRLRAKELEEQRLIQLKTQAELHALQSKTNPHFLFNAFNSIAGLIKSNPDKAEQMVVKLSTLFRYSLNSSQSNFVTIEEELKIVNTYLAIEKMRFGDQLDYLVECPKELIDQQIPRFLLQPLVENSVKHSSRQKHIRIELKIRQEESGMYMTIADNGPEFPESLKVGYGLQSTYDKLRLLYPEKHTLTLMNEPEKRIEIFLETLNSYV